MNETLRKAYERIDVDAVEMAGLYVELGDANDRIAALESERDRLTADNKRLREALRGVVRVADRKTVEFDAARAALKPHQGERTHHPLGVSQE